MAALMNTFRHLTTTVALLFALALAASAQPVPVTVTPVVAKRGMVVAGHPQAAEAGLAVLKAGGNAIDAAVATSLALGVCEPYASGLGGKLMLIYYEAASGQLDRCTRLSPPSRGRSQLRLRSGLRAGLARGPVARAPAVGDAALG